ncbi:hypothetical protein CWI36_0710p0010 [Hamiltosporidium magnivora]|uniref:Uncharacterized protein n=1 Tax=Hamiltosporidium magnivora TaxID=148818 RepID=A0A4Q9LAK6_9MICR|nr:hypothetical protein CWI36_0710p0010 [Hamiltosporidium magnivora]
MFTLSPSNFSCLKRSLNKPIDLTEEINYSTKHLHKLISYNSTEISTIIESFNQINANISSIQNLNSSISTFFRTFSLKYQNFMAEYNNNDRIYRRIENILKKVHSVDEIIYKLRQVDKTSLKYNSDPNNIYNTIIYIMDVEDTVHVFKDYLIYPDLLQCISKTKNGFTNKIKCLVDEYLCDICGKYEKIGNKEIKDMKNKEDIDNKNKYYMIFDEELPVHFKEFLLIYNIYISLNLKQKFVSYFNDKRKNLLFNLSNINQMIGFFVCEYYFIKEEGLLNLESKYDCCLKKIVSETIFDEKNKNLILNFYKILKNYGFEYTILEEEIKKQCYISMDGRFKELTQSNEEDENICVSKESINTYFYYFYDLILDVPQSKHELTDILLKYLDNLMNLSNLNKSEMKKNILNFTEKLKRNYKFTCLGKFKDENETLQREIKEIFKKTAFIKNKDLKDQNLKIIEIEKLLDIFDKISDKEDFSFGVNIVKESLKDIFNNPKYKDEYKRKIDGYIIVFYSYIEKKEPGCKNILEDIIKKIS